LADFARHPDLTFGAVKATPLERIRKNLVAVT
jgi:hypothetical protein